MFVVGVHSVCVEAWRSEGEDIRDGSVGRVLCGEEELDEEPSVLLLGMLVSEGMRCKER